MLRGVRSPASNLGILGGCCGTTPAHLEVVLRAIRHL